MQKDIRWIEGIPGTDNKITRGPASVEFIYQHTGNRVIGDMFLEKNRNLPSLEIKGSSVLTGVLSFPFGRPEMLTGWGFLNLPVPGVS